MENIEWNMQKRMQKREGGGKKCDRFCFHTMRGIYQTKTFLQDFLLRYSTLLCI